VAEPTPVIRWRCAGCKGLNIQVGMWVDPNTGAVDGIMDPGSWIHEEPQGHMSATFYCFDCQSHDHGVEPRPELVDEAQEVAAYLTGLANMGVCPQGLREALHGHSERLWRATGKGPHGSRLPKGVADGA